MTGYLVEVNNWPTKRQSYLLILLSQNLKGRYKLLCTVLTSFIVHIFRRIKRCILFGKCMAFFCVQKQLTFEETPKRFFWISKTVQEQKWHLHELNEWFWTSHSSICFCFPKQNRLLVKLFSPFTMVTFFFGQNVFLMGPIFPGDHVAACIAIFLHTPRLILYWSLHIQVDDKYQYSCENKDNRVHGWICFDPPVGFWQISPSNEFRTGGPTKQDLTSHVNPTTLAVCAWTNCNIFLKTLYFNHMNCLMIFKRSYRHWWKWY